MESKMQMVKVVEKNGARKRDPYLCQKKVVMVSWNNYKRKVSWYNAYFIQHYDVNGNILRHWILSQNDSVQKGITIFMYSDWTLTNNSSILKWNHNSFIQLYSKLLETNDLRHAILIETAQVQGSIEHLKATKKIWCPECSP